MDFVTSATEPTLDSALTVFRLPLGAIYPPSRSGLLIAQRDSNRARAIRKVAAISQRAGL